MSSDTSLLSYVSCHRFGAALIDPVPFLYSCYSDAYYLVVTFSTVYQYLYV